MKKLNNNFVSTITNDLLIAPCGMNCSVCMAYLRTRNKCPGCRVVYANKPKTRTLCKIKTCSSLPKGETGFCYQCEMFPCDNLKHLDKRYRTKYKMSIIDNLKSIKKSGLKKFIRNENKRWACANCSGTVCVHKGYCISCGELRKN